MLNQTETIKTDILIIGGGAAGLMAGIRAKEEAPDTEVTILEKAHVDRSGCLAMGLNAINLHLGNQTADQYVDYVAADNYGVVRRDLLKSIAHHVDRMADKLATLGVPFPETESGRGVKRSRRSLVMHGERLKPLLAARARNCGVQILNHTPVYELLRGEDGGVNGAAGCRLHSDTTVHVQSRATIIATGGAAGLYRPSTPGEARNKTWYCPFNAGGGLAMGIRAGAEMTSFEMRFVALRTKDVIAPTGTLAFNAAVHQRNARGEEYIKRRREQLGRPLTTSERLFATVEENRRGNGPCYLDLSELTGAQYDEMVCSYLQMAPGIALLLYEDAENPLKRIEVVGSEPYVNGGHGMAGFWVDEQRRTTVPRLYAAGDVAGGAPKKYLTGCFVEAEYAVLDALALQHDQPLPATMPTTRNLYSSLGTTEELTAIQLEERLQKIMDEYAGGASCYYESSESKLTTARELLIRLRGHQERVHARNRLEMMDVNDTVDRIDVAAVLVEHLLARCETRWPCYQSRADFPIRNDVEFKAFVNSKTENGVTQCFGRRVTAPYDKFDLG